jgi:hypothetical protein
LPVVSTPVVDVVRDYGDAGLVEIAAGPDAFAERLAALLARPRAAWLKRVDKHLAGLSWDRTWEAMRRALRDATPAGGAVVSLLGDDGATPAHRVPARPREGSPRHV